MHSYNNVKLFLQAVALVGLYSGVWFGFGVAVVHRHFTKGGRFED